MAAGGTVDAEQQPLVPEKKSSNEDSNEGDVALLHQYRIPLIILYYGVCSSTLIVINKVAVHNISAPVFILMLQVAFSAVVVKGCAVAGVLEAEKLRWGLVRPFVPFVAAFLGTLFSNIKVLMYSNVETFITFRSSTPLALSLLDWVFLGRQLPGGRSVVCLMLLVLSCAGYTYFDQGFKLQAYGWLCVWYTIFVFDCCYVKHMCDTVSMTNWGRVYYTNVLATVALLLVFPICTDEHVFLKAYTFTPPQIALLLLSCAVGVGMSHASYLLRSNVSATAAVVVGVVCKIGSVLINLLIWDQHASPIQLGFLFIGLAGGSFFQQAPMRSSKQLPVASAADGQKTLATSATEAVQQPAVHVASGLR